jgi:hypothetical protein
MENAVGCSSPAGPGECARVGRQHHTPFCADDMGAPVSEQVVAYANPYRKCEKAH